MRKGGPSFSSDDIVIKSPNDRRLYRHVELQNGLHALLVHDPEIYYPEVPPKTVQSNNNKEIDFSALLFNNLPYIYHEEGVKEEEDEGEEEEEERGGDEDGGGDEDDFKDVNGEGGAHHGATKAAAAAMCVGIGSLSDPLETQGLAHFLEHMLFMGSEKFPDENEYKSYLSKHGGSSNAYTDIEHTFYHFEVKPEFLKGALKRFSQFFISPLLKMEAMEREVLAVHSEFNRVQQSDAERLYQVQCYTSAPNHAFNKFFRGNKKSLLADYNSIMENGFDLREKMMKFYTDYYHAGSMKLVVGGGESLDVLESWVVELFGDVKNGRKEAAKRTEEFIKMEGPIWKPGKIYWLQAVEDVHTLDLSWPLPCLHKEYLKKPQEYLTFLLGHEGRGSLFYLFKSRGWATSLSAGIEDGGMYRSSITYIFCITIHLTDSGMKKIFDIIGLVYEYLKLLRQVPSLEWRYIFEELQSIGNMEFNFAEDQPQDDYALKLAENLHFYPPEHVIYGKYVYKTWDHKLIKHILGFFSPENMRVDVVSKSFFPKSSSSSSSSKEDIQTEPWFGSHFIERDIAQDLMELWKNPPEIDAKLHFPSKNEFIPSDFSIRLVNNPATNNHPKCIVDEPLVKFWYKLDTSVKLPRANTCFAIKLKGGYDNARSSVSSELFTRLLKDELNETIYQANIAKLETCVSFVGDKLELTVCGFNDKLPLLLSKLLYVVRSFVPTDIDRFEVIKEDMKKSLNNTNMKPLKHSTYLRLQVLCKSFYDVDEKLSHLDNLFLEDLKSFISNLRSQLHITGHCFGNMSEEEAINISNIIKTNFPVQPLPSNELRHVDHERVTCLPPSSNLVRDARVKNELEKNSVAELYFQIHQPHVSMGSNTKLKALIDLFSEIVEEPFFNQLRTKEQLGYFVKCSPKPTYSVFGFSFKVQSCGYNPIYLQARIENFVDVYLEQLLQGLDDDSLENYKSGLMAKLLGKDQSLGYKTNYRLWNDTVDEKKEAQEVRSISNKHVLAWYMTYLKRSSPNCRRLAIRVWGCNTNLKDADEANKTLQHDVIVDPEGFKMSSELYLAS